MSNVDFGKREIRIVEVDQMGKPINSGYLSSRFHKCILANGLPYIMLHGLRHSVASIANEAGVTLFDISKLIGHSSPDIIGKVYTYLFDITNTEALGRIAKVIGEDGSINQKRS